MQQAQLIEESLHKDVQDEVAIFQSQEHFQKEIKCLCHGDLYVIGNVWIQALRAVLVGANFSLIPVVNAAKPEDGPPARPPKMKYKDLPIYESPHYEYKDYVADQTKCPKSNVKILQTYLYPKVARWRKSWADSISEFNKDLGEMKNDGRAFVCKKKNAFVSYMRSENNLALRQTVVATGMATGFYFGRGAGVLRRLFCTTLGALATGALCFPKETDKIFREISFNVGKFAVTMFNDICGRQLVLRERVPCREDLPPPPPPRPPEQRNKCDAKKKQ